MAYYQFLSQIENDCLFSSFENLLKDVGLSISEECSTNAEIFAEEKVVSSKYHSKVKVIISWSNKSLRQCSIEVRSDEPSFIKDTACEKLADQLRELASL